MAQHLRLVEISPSSAQATPEPELPAIDDEALVLRALEGDRWAEDALARRYLREVTAVVTRLLGSYQDVDDVVQDAFLYAFAQLGKLRKPAVFRGWLLRIAVNQVRRAIRKRKLRRAFGLDRTYDDASLELLAHRSARPELHSELAVLDEVLRRMPTEHRLAWMLRYVEGHTVSDTAKLCSCSLATVKRRLSTAHAKVKNAVDLEVLNHG